MLTDLGNVSARSTYVVLTVDERFQVTILHIRQYDLNVVRIHDDPENVQDVVVLEIFHHSRFFQELYRILLGSVGIVYEKEKKGTKLYRILSKFGNTIDLFINPSLSKLRNHIDQ